MPRIASNRLGLVVVTSVMVMSLAACGGRGGFGGNLFGGPSAGERALRAQQQQLQGDGQGANRVPLGEGPVAGFETQGRQSIWDLFRGSEDAELSTNVNRYLWQASLDVLNFLPVETVDPFSGVIATGYGTPPGGGRSYLATVYISDPALDARSLRLAMQQRGGGAVSPQVVRQIEDAILTRARELRVRDSRI